MARGYDHSRFLVREPLARQGWPIQSMRDNQIIQIGCVLLPIVGVLVIHGRCSAPPVARTMSCIPVTVLESCKLYLGMVDMHLVD